MITLDAVTWSYNKPRKPLKSYSKTENNKRMQDSAELHAEEMRLQPSPLEKMMQEFLNNHNIKYEFQKIFYIAGRDRYITQYYIADFYIPSKKLIIEMDGKFHNKQKKADYKRTETIRNHYKKVKVIRFAYYDMQSVKKLSELLERLK